MKDDTRTGQWLLRAQLDRLERVKQVERDRLKKKYGTASVKVLIDEAIKAYLRKKEKKLSL